jgi:hypothetical protein
VFLDPLVLVFEGGRFWRLAARLRYSSSRLGTIVAVPEGFWTDLASTPRPLWPVLPPSGRYAIAAVLHDYLYRLGAVPNVTRKEADEAFRDAMADAPRPVSLPARWLLYWAVRRWSGPAWHRREVDWQPSPEDRRDEAVA